MKTTFKKLCSILFILILWQLAAMVFNRPLLLPTPVQSFESFAELATQAIFYQSIVHTLFYSLIGFVFAFICSLLIAYFAYCHPVFKQSLGSLLTFVNSLPVACFSLLLLLWLKSEGLTLAVSFLVVFPQNYFAALNGLENISPVYLQIADLMGASEFQKVFRIERFMIASYINASASSSCGMALKSAIAAELIGCISTSLGGRLYYAKIYLDSPALFAYILVIYILGILLEKIILFAVGKLFPICKDAQIASR